MSRHHLFLSPSVTAPDGDSEGGAPVSIIEAAATGMPVVSTTHCDIPQAVDDGVTRAARPRGRSAGAGRTASADCSTTPERWPDDGRRRRASGAGAVRRAPLRGASSWSGIGRSSPRRGTRSSTPVAEVLALVASRHAGDDDAQGAGRRCAKNSSTPFTVSAVVSSEPQDDDDAVDDGAPSRPRLRRRTWAERRRARSPTLAPASSRTCGELARAHDLAGVGRQRPGRQQGELELAAADGLVGGGLDRPRPAGVVTAAWSSSLKGRIWSGVRERRGARRPRS